MNEPLVFNPLDPAFRIDPYPTYARLRAEDPVHQAEFGALVFSRYDDCLALLRDPRSSSDGRNSTAYKEAIEQGTVDSEMLIMEEPSFLFLDPPDHTRLRGLVNKAFTPRVVERLRPRIQTRVDQLLDAAAEQGSLEIIEDLAYPLPVAVICEMLGVPVEDHVTFREWSRQAARSLDPEEALSPEEQEQRRNVIESFRNYFRGLIAERRKNPQDDLISALIAAEDEGNKLSEQELLSTCILLLIAGHETTVNLIGNGVLALLEHPEQMEMLRSDPSLIKPAIEELLRYGSPLKTATERYAREDVTVAGVTIPRGSLVFAVIASANRDERQFADPDTLDITREPNRLLSFGMGAHSCLGPSLARAEAQIATHTPLPPTPL